MKLRYPQCFSTWFRKSPRNETTICFPSLKGSARLAILFFVEKTAANLKSILKSCELSEGFFGRFSRICSDFDGGRGIDEPPKWSHFYIFCASASAKVCRVMVPKLAGSDFELSHTIFKCWQTHEIHQHLSADRCINSNIITGSNIDPRGEGGRRAPKMITFFHFSCCMKCESVSNYFPQTEGVSLWGLPITIFKCSQMHGIHLLQCRVESEKVQKDDEHEVLSDAIDAPNRWQNNIKHHKKRVPTLIPGGGGLLNRSAGYAPGLFVLTQIQGKVSIWCPLVLQFW